MKILRARKTGGTVESFSGELKHAWAHSREFEIARVEVRGGGGEGDGMGWSRAPEESSSASTRYQALLKVHKHREVKRELWPWLAVN